MYSAVAIPSSSILFQFPRLPTDRFGFELKVEDLFKGGVLVAAGGQTAPASGMRYV